MTQFNITGMSCAACVARVEKAVNSVEGVESCSVSLLTNSMGVEGNTDVNAIIKAVTDAGYGATLKDNKNAPSKTANDDTLKDIETPKLKKRLVASLGFLLVLMYISMGHIMWGWWLPEILATNPLAIGLSELLLTAIVVVINQKFFVNGFKGLLHKS
ncbi:MAG: cation-translocating P-type ATPase, partial [Alistipes sp.]|nr:cation-translocating P-type ATPase [Alistipes sp.]